MKLLKKIGVGFLAILGLIGVFLLYLNFTNIPSYDIVKLDYQVKSSPEIIQRGKKLSSMLCANCHYNDKTGKLTGKKMLDAPEEFGEIFSQNITQNKAYGIGEWTDGELLYLLRTGIKRDGQYSPPYMSKFPLMADDDLNAIIAYLRSDDKLVTASPVNDEPCKPSLLTKLLSRLAFKPLPLPKAKIEMPDTNNVVELGEYLAHNLDCFSCHSADFKSNDYLNPSKSVGYFAGGNKILNEEGRLKISSNLTPDPETGIGNWSKDQFLKAVKFGIKDGEAALSYPMMPYVYLTDHEVEAIFEFLKTIPAVNNKVERMIYN